MLILSSVLALALIAADEPKPSKAPAVVTLGEFKADSRETWNLSLPEAIRIGLDNSEVVRVISLGAQGIPLGSFEPTPLNNVVGVEPPGSPEIVIAQVNRDASIWNFKSAVMAHVRSIEQQYWALSMEQVALWSRETAVQLGTEILRRQQAELEAGRGTTADVAEAKQQLENFKLNLVSATSDLITTERQLRNILGLPVTDDRRIVPITPPTEARLEPDWESCVREMTDSQPDIAQQNVVVRLQELQLLLARNQVLPLLGMDALHQFKGLGGLLDVAGPGLSDLIRRDAARRYPAGLDPSEPSEPEFINRQVGLTTPFVGFPAPLYNTRRAQYQLLRQRADLRQIVHQSTHTLARFFLEVDANYKQFRTAQGLRTAAQQRLEAQRAFYEEGRITIDRLLDAVSQYANAIAQEAQYKASYNTSIAALEEAKGTLLAYDKITIAEPGPRKAYLQAKDDRVAQASLEGPAGTSPEKAQPVPTMSTYKLRAKLGGVKFLEIEVEVNPAPPTPVH